jgi:chemotaxis protein CheX
MDTSMLADAIEELTMAVWMQTLELPLLPSTATPPAGAAHTIQAYVHVSGAWRGTIVVQCPMSLARVATQRMFRLDGVPPLEDVQDAIGELTNMIGGSVKALIAGENCFLSLPVVVEGHDYRVRVGGGAQVLTQHLMRCEDEPLLVTVLEGRSSGL